MLMKTNPAREAKAHTATTVAPLNGALRKKRRSMRGSRRRLEQQTTGQCDGGDHGEHDARLDDRVGERGEEGDDEQLSDRAVRRGFGARDSGT